jgi:two-component system sensor histidine kinase PilS (NtrC family)
MGSVELLKGSGLKDDDRRLLDILLREGGRLSVLVAEFLAFARPAAQRREPVDLAELAGQTLEAFALDPAAAGVRLERALASATVLGDPDQLRQVLWNLLLNAGQAIATGGAGAGTIRVGCRPAEGGGADLTVEDDGPGIDPADRERLFTPFFTTKPAGTGLGLATIHRIVDGHGGAVSVDAPPGGGARFAIHLPPPGAAGPG